MLGRVSSAGCRGDCRSEHARAEVNIYMHVYVDSEVVQHVSIFIVTCQYL